MFWRRRKRNDPPLSKTSSDQTEQSIEEHAHDQGNESYKYLPDNVFIGSRLQVWWPGEKQYYPGVLEKLQEMNAKSDDVGMSQNPHFIKYDDGDEEWTNLFERDFKLIKQNNDKKNNGQSNRRTAHMTKDDRGVEWTESSKQNVSNVVNNKRRTKTSPRRTRRAKLG